MRTIVLTKSVFFTSIITFTLLIVASNYTVTIPINEWLTLGAIMYPFTFLLTDVLSERYSKAEVKKVVQYGIYLAFIPSIFAADLRIAAASIATFVVSQNIDISIFHFLKHRFSSQWWLRNNASTMLSQFVDTAMFFSLAFLGQMPITALVKLIFGDYLIKFIIAVFDTPLFYFLAVRRKKELQL